MAEVTVSINGRHYRMACDEGQQQHLTDLAAMLNRRIAELREQFGEVGDARLMVMAAIMIADEAADAAKRLRQLEEEVSSLTLARAGAAERAQTTQAAIVAAFTSAAERIEAIAGKLAHSPDDEVARG